MMGLVISENIRFAGSYTGGAKYAIRNLEPWRSIRDLSKADLHFAEWSFGFHEDFIQRDVFLFEQRLHLSL